MREFIESLRRLFANGMLDENKVLDLFTKGRISEEEKDYILRPI